MQHPPTTHHAHSAVARAPLVSLRHPAVPHVGQCTCHVGVGQQGACEGVGGRVGGRGRHQGAGGGARDRGSGTAGVGEGRLGEGRGVEAVGERGRGREGKVSMVCRAVGIGWWGKGVVSGGREEKRPLARAIM